jgi:predicted chitinase
MDTLISPLKKALLEEKFSKELISAILGNIKIESGFKCITENMNYSSVERLRTVFPSKFKTLTDAKVKTYVNNPKVLGDLVYAELGGYDYRGRGYIQLTGKDNYTKYGKKYGVVEKPELANEPSIAVKMVGEYIRLIAFPLYKGDLNACKDIDVVSDIVSKAIQGPGKNYTTGFLATTLVERRKAAKAIYLAYDKY